MPAAQRFRAAMCPSLSQVAAEVGRGESSSVSVFLGPFDPNEDAIFPITCEHARRTVILNLRTRPTDGGLREAATFVNIPHWSINGPIRTMGLPADGSVVIARRVSVSPRRTRSRYGKAMSRYLIGAVHDGI